MFDAFYDVAALAKDGNANAQSVMQSWADAEWFTKRDELPESLKMVVFKVTGETNTDDLSPAPDAWSRPDIPLHARAMYKMTRRTGARRARQSRPHGPNRSGEGDWLTGRVCRRRRRHRLVQKVRR